MDTQWALDRRETGTVDTDMDMDMDTEMDMVTDMDMVTYMDTWTCTCLCT